MAAIWEKYLAQVTNNQDPDQLGRIKVSCPDLIGAYPTEEEDVELADWIDPIHDWSWFYIPDVDEVIEIEVRVSSDEDEVPMQSTIYNPVIRWRGKRYWAGEETPSPRPVPEDFKTNYGKRRGFATPWGHVLLFDDTEGKELVRLSLHRKEGEDDKYSFIAFNETGSIVLANQNGTLVHMDAENQAFSIIDEHGNIYATDSMGAKVIDKFGNFIELKDGLIQVISQGGVAINAANNADITCDKVNLLADTEVNLGDSADTPVLRGADTKSEYDNHTHPTGTGPSGTTTPLTPATLSTKVNTE